MNIRVISGSWPKKLAVERLRQNLDQRLRDHRVLREETGIISPSIIYNRRLLWSTDLLLIFVRGKKNKGNARNISGIPEESFVKKSLRIQRKMSVS